MIDFVDSVVVGAGLVGLAVARRLALAGHDVLVLEGQRAVGTGVSSRNSEVIHAGIYYPPGSLKAALCVAGARDLYAYCERHGVPFRRVGKLIVATDPGQLPQLEALRATALANGVTDLVALDGAQALRLEPALTAHAALLSPSTGIVDSHALMLAFQGEAEAAGARVALASPLLSADVASDPIRLTVGGAEPLRLDCGRLVNAAALEAPALARCFTGLPQETVPASHLCKGSYFQLSGRAPFDRLIYPIPQAAGLGIHLTLDLGGQARFGPDVEWVEREEYQVEPARSARFYDAIRRYWRDLPDGALQPAYAGIRPKISGPADPAADFVISGPADHGIAGLVNLFGIESPGLTASLAIADRVLHALDE